MALGLELKLRMGLQLVMTPQLQLAIRLLQMSNLELTEYLQEELDRNPLLEQVDDEFSLASDSTPPPRMESSSVPEREERERSDEYGEGYREEYGSDYGSSWDGEEKGDYEGGRELPVDASWSDIYGDPVGGGGGSGKGGDPNEAPPIENTLTRAGTLIDHLIWQLNLSAQNERERALGLVLIDAIDDNGYLHADLETLARAIKATVDELEDVLVLVQSFEPAGVGARSLAECLKLQLKAKGMARPPYTRLLDHLEDLARRDYRKLTRVLKLTEEALAEAVTVIQSLNPKPGLAFGDDQAAYVTPDVFVRRHEGQWVVDINPDTMPKLRLNRYYQDAMNRRMSEQDRRFMSDNSRSAQWLIKSLEQRTRTILKVAESIVRFQREFFDFGPERLKPLILKDVADDVGVHESTISRVTNNKYMHTPRGIFELKYFFSSSLSSSTAGENHSSEAVKHKIRKLVEDEPPRRPHSDEKLVKLLEVEGIQVARRTVAKYREALGIASSSRRKKLSPDG